MTYDERELIELRKLLRKILKEHTKMDCLSESTIKEIIASVQRAK